MIDRRQRALRRIISRSSMRDRALAVERLAAVIETEMLVFVGHTASAAVVIVAARRRVSTSTLWRWKALVRGEYDDVGRLRWLLPRPLRRDRHRNSEILSLEEVL
jgi:hypothetical protein